MGWPLAQECQLFWLFAAEWALLVAEAAFAGDAEAVAAAADWVTAVELVLALVDLAGAAEVVLLVVLEVGALSFLAQPARAITPRASAAARRAYGPRCGVRELER